MSQKKAGGPSAKKPAGPAKPAPAAAAVSTEPPKRVAFDRERLEAFILGRITLGEMEGIGKDLQYEMAKKGFRVLNEGKLDMARGIFRGLLALDPFDSYFHTALGAVLQREGKYPESDEAYSHAIQFNPYNSTAFANRGEVRLQLGRVMEAAEDIKKAVALDPKGKDPATLRARVLSVAISEVIRDNQQAILAELKKVQAKAPAKPGAVQKPPAGKGAPAAKPGAKPAAKPAAAKPAVPAKKK
ncbi:MAG: hypothetical protein AB2A00_19990 [Myxococcota bacterium]